MATFSLVLDWSIVVVDNCVQKFLVYTAAVHDEKLRFFLNLSVSHPSDTEYTHTVNIGSRG